MLLCLLASSAKSALAGYDTVSSPHDPIEPLEIVSIKAGFADHYKQGYWAPFQVRLRGGSQSVTVRLDVGAPDADGVQTYTPLPENRPLQLTRGAETTVQIFLKIGSLKPTFTVRAFAEGGARPYQIQREFVTGEPDAPAEALSATRPLYVSIGGQAAIDQHATEPSLPERYRPVVAELHAADEAPARWLGYEGVDAVVLFTDQPGVLRSLTAGSARWDALEGWVRRGGMLVLSVGRAAGEAFAADSPLAALAPGHFEGLVPLRQTTAWELFAETPDPLKLEAGPGGAAGRLEAPRLTDIRGKVEAFEGTRSSNLPLIVRSPHGFGEVVFVAADLDRPPFSAWPGRQQFWDKLLGRVKPPANEQDQNSGQVTRLGYDDLAGQLHSALEQFSGVNVPFSLVVLLIAVYIACIGPLDYFVLKRYFRRMEWTWITFPAMVVGFSLGAYVLARELKGEQLRVNQADLVDVDVASGFVRGTMWSMVFSPQSDLYNVSLKTSLPREAARAAAGADSKAPAVANEPVAGDVLLSWLGLPGEGLGGMAMRTPAASLFDNEYRFGPQLATLEDLPIAVWSTKGFTARWSVADRRLANADLYATPDGQLSGTFENLSALRLTGAVVVYDRWAYPLGDIEPGRVVRLDGRIDPRTVETYFRQSAPGQARNSIRPYQASALEVDRVLEIMLMHDSVGGSTYTRLGNVYQGHLDAMRQLRAGRAVLLGRAAEPATSLERDGAPLAGPQDQHWTFYRFMLPVAPASR